MTRDPQESDSLHRFRKDAPRHYWRCFVECPDCGGVGMHVSESVDENGYPMIECSCTTCNENGFLHDYGWRDSLVHLKRARDSYASARGLQSKTYYRERYMATKRAAMPFPNLRRLDTNVAFGQMMRAGTAVIQEIDRINDVFRQARAA